VLSDAAAACSGRPSGAAASDGLRRGRIVVIRDRMVPAELDVPLVQGVCEDVVIVVRWQERAGEDRLDLEGGAHAAELEVAEP